MKRPLQDGTFFGNVFACRSPKSPVLGTFSASSSSSRHPTTPRPPTSSKSRCRTRLGRRWSSRRTPDRRDVFGAPATGPGPLRRSDEGRPSAARRIADALIAALQVSSSASTAATNHPASRVLLQRYTALPPQRKPQSNPTLTRTEPSSRSSTRFTLNRTQLLCRTTFPGAGGGGPREHGCSTGESSPLSRINSPADGSVPFTHT